MDRREFDGVPATIKTPLDINLISQTEQPACYIFVLTLKPVDNIFQIMHH